jgi:hypothetical protein
VDLGARYVRSLSVDEKFDQFRSVGRNNGITLREVKQKTGIEGLIEGKGNYWDGVRRSDIPSAR